MSCEIVLLLTAPNITEQASNTSSVTLTLPSYADLTKVPSTAARRFPFVTHLDLLASPEEGTFFDPDDFVDR